MLLAIKTLKTPNVIAFNKRLESGLLKPIHHVKNPISGKLHIKDIGKYRLHILDIKLHILPFYMLPAVTLLIYFLFTNIYTQLLFIFSLIGLLPYLNITWLFMYMLGLHKAGYKKEIKSISYKKAVRDLIG